MTEVNGINVWLRFFSVLVSELCRWLSGKAEELGVDIFPGFAGKDVLSGPNESVAGVLTNDVGVDKNGIPKSNLQLGIELRAKATLLGEGCRGSLSQVITMLKVNPFMLHKLGLIDSHSLWASHKIVAIRQRGQITHLSSRYHQS